MEHLSLIAYITTPLLGGEDEAAAAEDAKLRGADVWGEFIKFARPRRGPYLSQVRGWGDAKLLRVACKLHPRGPPKAGDRCLPMCTYRN